MFARLAAGIIAILMFGNTATAAPTQVDTSAGKPPQVDTNAVKVAVREALAVRDSLKKAKTLKVGLSLGVRQISSKSALLRNVTVKPDSTIVADAIDRKDVVLSGVLVVFPWQNRQAPDQAEAKSTDCSFPRPLGFIANVALASFSPDNVSQFNKSLEGGFGLAYKLGDEFALAFTWERMFSRRLRSWVEVGVTKFPGPTEAGTTLENSNDRYFYSDNMSALSLKFVYFF